VYIDRERITDDEAKDEYVIRMNKGIADALAFGVPREYVENVMREFIPPLGGRMDERIAKKARQQALNFQDENEE
jgi:hypothetical protein